MPRCSTVMTEMRLLWLRLLVGGMMIFLLNPFLPTLGGAPKMDFPLSLLSSLTFLVLISVTSLLSELSLLVRGTKITLFKSLEEVLQEEREWSYSRPILSDADFWTFNISSSLALEVLSSFALTKNSLASNFLAFSTRRLFSNLSASMVWLVSSNLLTLTPLTLLPHQLHLLLP